MPFIRQVEDDGAGRVAVIGMLLVVALVVLAAYIL
jgi:hypothetical protein